MRRRWSRGLPCLAGLMLTVATGCSGPPEQPASPEQPVSPAKQAPSEAVASRADGTGRLLGTVPLATGGFASVVIIETPDPGALAVPTQPVILDQVAMAFVPDVLIARLGQPVEVRNSDDALHNVHVVDLATKASVTNVASPPLGGGVPLVFEKAGAYEVQCNIHPAMGAFIVVTSSPYTTIAAPDGNFTLDGVPYGSYTLRVWNLDAAQRSEQAITIDAATTRVSVGKNR